MKRYKTKRFSVLYEVTTSFEAVVDAKNVEEAKNKVLEVIGEPIKFGGVCEIKG